VGKLTFFLMNIKKEKLLYMGKLIEYTSTFYKIQK